MVPELLQEDCQVSHLGAHLWSCLFGNQQRGASLCNKQETIFDKQSGGGLGSPKIRHKLIIEKR